LNLKKIVNEFLEKVYLKQPVDFIYLRAARYYLDFKWRLDFKRFQNSFDREKAGKELSVVLLTVDPAPMLPQVKASLEDQTVKPAKIHLIRNVAPFSKASQQGLDQVNTPFYVSVDDDMILDPDCFEKHFYYLYKYPKTADVALRLKDPIIGQIYGVHMYRTEPVRKIGFHPLVNEKGAERRMTESLEKAGYQTITVNRMGGIHHPEYTIKDIYWKFRFHGQQTRFYKDKRGKGPLNRELTKICQRWLREQDAVSLAGLAGFFDGLQSEDIDSQLDFTERDSHQPFLRTLEMLKNQGFIDSGHCSDLTLP
jgi:hypothetical protein